MLFDEVLVDNLHRVLLVGAEFGGQNDLQTSRTLVRQTPTQEGIERALTFANEPSPSCLPNSNDEKDSFSSIAFRQVP